MSYDKKTDLKERASNIWKKLKIGKVLYDLGYDLDPYNETNQQFRCDLHGSDDEHPSASIYFESNSWYCFACQKKRDAIKTVEDKQKKGYEEAILYLEKKYNISPPKPQVLELVEVAGRDFVQVRDDIHTFLLHLTRNRYLQIDSAVRLWNSFDMLCSSEFRNSYHESDLKNSLISIRSEALSLIDETS